MTQERSEESLAMIEFLSRTMSPGGGGGDGVTEKDPPPATSPRGRGEDAPSRSPWLPVVAPEKKKKKLTREHEQQPAVDLSDDVLIEILSRVPYKSLCRFKCVSKPWLDLCSGLDIRKRSPLTLSGLYFYGKRRYAGLYFHDLARGGPPLFNAGLSFLANSDYQRYIVEKCCGGLLLCMCWKPRSVQEDYVVCNPATEKCTVLPAIEVRDRPEILRLAGHHLCDVDQAKRFLGFDTANPSIFVVVVPLQNWSFDVIKEVAIYSSETGQWTFALSEWSRSAMVRPDQVAVFLNGIIHLTTFNSSIVTVDSAGKIWRKIKAPCLSEEAIGLSQGCLHTWTVDDHCQLFVWVLEDYDSGKWTLKHTANVLGLFGRHSRNDDESYKMLAMHPDCNSFFLTDGKMTVLYNMDNQKLQVISASQELVSCTPYIPCFAKWPSVTQ